MHRLLLALLMLFAALPGAAATDPSDDRRAIEAVVERFRHAIVAKDRPAFLGLFLHEGVTWQSVMSEERLRATRAKEPGAVRAAYQPGQTPAKFIEGIVGDTAAIEETFEHVRIDTDGAAASVAFDFRFLRNGQVINLGREYWLLAKTDTGWKIAAVVWSRNSPAQNP